MRTPGNFPQTDTMTLADAHFYFSINLFILIFSQIPVQVNNANAAIYRQSINLDKEQHKKRRGVFITPFALIPYSGNIYFCLLF